MRHHHCHCQLDEELVLPTPARLKYCVMRPLVAGFASVDPGIHLPVFHCSLCCICVCGDVVAVCISATGVGVFCMGGSVVSVCCIQIASSVVNMEELKGSSFCVLNLFFLLNCFSICLKSFLDSADSPLNQHFAHHLNTFQT